MVTLGGIGNAQFRNGEVTMEYRAVRVHNTGGGFWNTHLASGRFTDFTTPFIENGFLFPESEDSNFTHFISWGNMAPNAIANACADIPLSNRVLILVEPRVMEPWTWSKQTLSQFGHVYAASRQWADKINCEFFNWPQIMSSSISKESPTLLEPRLKRVAIIQTSKFNSIRGEKFSLRRLAIRRLMKSGIPIDVYGSYWHATIIQNIYRKFHAFYKALTFAKYGSDFKFDIFDFRAIRTKRQNNLGFVENVFDTLSKYEYCLVIENCDDYVSEKLFNALNAGCKVVYVGPNLREHGLFMNSVVEAEHTPESIVEKFIKLFAIAEKHDHLVIKNEAIEWSKFADSSIVHKDLAQRIVNAFLDDLIIR